MNAWPSAENDPVVESEAPITMGDLLVAPPEVLELLEQAARVAVRMAAVTPTDKNRALRGVIPGPPSR
jgi:hypothetical protein